MDWTPERRDAIQAVIDELQAMVDFKVAEEVLLFPVLPLFRDTEQLFFMGRATLLAHLSECDVACYPLSVSSVLFIED